MKKIKFFRFFFAICSFTLLFFAVTSDPVLPGILVAGVLPAGLIGDVKNKIGNVVAFKWKDINAVRSYVIPSNPNSPDQQIQRARMAASVDIARQLLGDLLQPYWDPFYSSMSGFNAWIKQNIMLLTAGTYNLNTTCIMSKGTLLGIQALAAVYTTGTGAVDYTWTDNTNGSTGLATDLFVAVVCTSAGTVELVKVTANTREDEASSVTVSTGLTAATLLCFGFFVQGSGASLTVSDSSVDTGS